MSFEFGVVDAKGREGVARISSYKVRSFSLPRDGISLTPQSEPTAHPHRSPPLVHLPLKLPSTDQHTLTSWLDIKLNLATLLPLFRSLPSSSKPTDNQKRRKVEADVPNEQFGYVSYVRVYANCRLRRIWFVSPSLRRNRCEALHLILVQSADGERTLNQAGVEEEWGLYAASTSPRA